MKKSFLLLGCLCLLAVGMLSVACSKDDWKGCSCTLSAMYLGNTPFEVEFEDIPASILKEVGVKNCPQLVEMWWNDEDFWESIAEDIDEWLEGEEWNEDDFSNTKLVCINI